MIKNIKAFLPKRHSDRFSNILITPTTVTATDSFKVIEVTPENGKHTTGTDTFTVPLPATVKTFEYVERVGTGADIYHKGAIHKVPRTGDASEYPDVARIFKEATENPERVSLTLSADHLKEIAQAFEVAKGSPADGKIIVSVEKNPKHANGGHVLFTNPKGTIRALLAPLNK